MLQLSSQYRTVEPGTFERTGDIAPTESRPPFGADSLPVGYAIRERRRSLRLVQEELAQRAGLKRTYISDIETNDRNISIKTLTVIAKALGMTTSQLVAMAESIAQAEETLAVPEGAD